MLNDAEKIDLVRSGRAYYTWLMPLGIAKNTIAEIKEGNIPMTDTLLTALSRCENVSMSWLLEDKGAPFRVARFDNDIECAEATALHLSEEAWEVCLVTDSHRRAALVLTMPANFQRARGKHVEYTAVEVLADAGPRAIAEAATNASIFRRAVIAPEDMEDLINGFIGSYALLGDGKKDKGIISDAEVIGMGERIDTYTFGFDDRAGNIINEPGPYKINHDEYLIIAKYRQLSDDDRELVRNLFKRLG